MPQTENQRQVALCLLVLVNEHWVPLALNAQSMNKYRSSPDGPVITAQFVADVEGGQIVGWREPVFEARDVNEDGSLDYNLHEVAAMMDAPQSDAEADEVGAIGISRRLIERRRERRRGAISTRLRAAAHDRAMVQIADRLRGVKTTGVTLVPA
jgi:hypothetical protein